MPKSTQIEPWVATILTLSMAGGVGLAGVYFWLIKPFMSRTSAHITISILVVICLIISGCVVNKEIKEKRVAQ